MGSRKCFEKTKNLLLYLLSIELITKIFWDEKIIYFLIFYFQDNSNGLKNTWIAEMLNTI